MSDILDRAFPSPELETELSKKIADHFVITGDAPDKHRSPMYQYAIDLMLEAQENLIKKVAEPNQ